MKCQSILFSSDQASMASQVNSVPWSETIIPPNFAFQLYSLVQERHASAPNQRTPAQIILRWHIECGEGIISRRHHLKEDAGALLTARIAMQEEYPGGP